MNYDLTEETMDTKDRWNEVKHQLEGAVLTLSSKTSTMIRKWSMGCFLLLPDISLL